MKVYIAGPMSGLPDFNYPAFHEAAKALQAVGHTYHNPANAESLNTTGKPQSWDWYMRHAITMLVHAEGVALLPGWEKSKGATLEHLIALQLGMEIRPLQEWLS